MTQYDQFKELTDELYPDCTTEQKLGVYIQHRPAAVVPFLLELIEKLERVQSSLDHLKVHHNEAHDQIRQLKRKLTDDTERRD